MKFTNLIMNGQSKKNN